MDIRNINAINFLVTGSMENIGSIHPKHHVSSLVPLGPNAALLRAPFYPDYPNNNAMSRALMTTSTRSQSYEWILERHIFSFLNARHRRKRSQSSLYNWLIVSAEFVIWDHAMNSILNEKRRIKRTFVSNTCYWRKQAVCSVNFGIQIFEMEKEKRNLIGRWR